MKTEAEIVLEQTRGLSEEIVGWLEGFFRATGAKSAVVGISGGKDSAVCAALCARAIGRKNVFGVMMPNGRQGDIGDSRAVCDAIGISGIEVNVEKAYRDLCEQIGAQLVGLGELSVQARVNLAPRLRMATLYAVAQSLDRGRVCCCTNASEAYVGYGTLFGDFAGDFAPLLGLTVSEVVGVGRVLGVPEAILSKPPADGLTGKSDEEALGVSYGEIEAAMRGGACGEEALRKISRMHENSQFKRNIVRIPHCERTR